MAVRLRRRSVEARLPGSRVRIPLRAGMFVSYVCCGLCTKRPLRRADHAFRRVISGVCASTVRRARPEMGCYKKKKKGTANKLSSDAAPHPRRMEYYSSLQYTARCNIHYTANGAT